MSLWGCLQGRPFFLLRENDGHVGLSNILDGELLRKIIQGVKGVAGIESLLILAVAALDFAVVPRRAYHAVSLRRKSAEE